MNPWKVLTLLSLDTSRAASFIVGVLAVKMPSLILLRPLLIPPPWVLPTLGDSLCPRLPRPPIPAPDPQALILNDPLKMKAQPRLPPQVRPLDKTSGLWSTQHLVLVPK